MILGHRWRAAAIVAGLAAIVCLPGCAHPARVSEAEPAAADQATARESPRSSSAQPTSQPVVSGGESASESDEASGPPYRFRLKPQPDELLYYTIENEIRDLYGFPPLLSVTASIKERRFIKQQMAIAKGGQSTDRPGDKHLAMSWTCERYEVRERGMKDEVSFDSVRDLYPPPSLWLLGGIPGSVCTFELDPNSGSASRIMPRPAQIAGSSGSAKLSRTAEKAALTTENLKALLDDLGPLYLPDSPKAIGEQWSRTFREDRKSIGTLVTTATCTLRSVREAEDRKIATIEIASEMALEPEVGSTSNPAGVRSGGASTKKSTGTQPYKLDKGDLSGTVEFDLTRGELLSLKLHREAEFFAELEASGGNAMVKEIRTGSSQDLRVTTSRTPTPMPVIVGGKKPPVVPADSEPKPVASQPAGKPVGATPGAPTTTQASPVPSPTSRPAGLIPIPSRPSSQPKARSGARGPARAATRPAVRPAQPPPSGKPPTPGD